MKLYDEKIQDHLLNGGKIKKKLGTFEVVLHIDENGFFTDDDFDYYQLNNFDLISNDWEIVTSKYNSEYNWNKIIKDKALCVFSDYEDFRAYTISPLIEVEDNGFSFKTIDELSYTYCKLFNPTEFNIVTNLEEYKK